MSPDEIRWRDELSERIAIMMESGVADAPYKALQDIRECQRRERETQAQLFEERGR